MATSIGSVLCDFLVGLPPPPELADEVKFSHRAGVAGLRAENLGTRGGPFILRATKIDTSANIDIWKAALAALAGGAAVIVETDDGKTYSNCYIGAEGSPPTRQARREAVREDNSAKQICVMFVVGERSAT